MTPAARAAAVLLLALLAGCGGAAAPGPPWDPSGVEAALPDVAAALDEDSGQQALDLLNRHALDGPLPDGAEHLRARALTRLKRTQEARAAWERQLQAHSGDGRGHALLALMLLDAGETDEAAPHLEAALALAGRDPATQCAAGRAALLRHEDETASRHFRDALTAEPFGAHAADAHRALAEIAAHAGTARQPEAAEHRQAADRIDRLREQLAACRQRLLAHPRDVEAAYGVAAAWLNFYVAMEHDSRLRAPAEAAVMAVLALRPDDPRALSNLGFLRTEESRANEALELFRKALAVDPEAAETRLSLGMLLQKLGQADEARAEFRRVVQGGKAGPENVARARLRLAELYEHGTEPGDRERAVEEYRALLALYPDDRLGVKASLDRLLAPPADGH
ncbi:MAG TPA: tetratricopeptide repeat protein [Planctomycetota bacterium]|nr:tetratricopeptide repeat protein [Planctomycetota bacterium]